ncbi:MAG: hypothetical protein WCQ47_06000 [bacterium]
MWKKLFALFFIATLFAGCGTPVATQTTLKVKNSSSQNVVVWLTLGEVDGFVSNVNGIFGITDSGLQGSFILKASTEREYTPDKGISGNLSFGVNPINCPTTGFTNGVNIFEFSLNNESQAGTPQETIDISNVAGVNSLLKASLSGGGGWNAGTAHTGISSFQNAALYSNTGLVGVFPYGSDNCTSSVSPPLCTGSHPAYETSQSEAICNVQRDAVNHGGIVTIEFLGFTP